MDKREKNETGFSNIVVILVVVIVALIGVIGFMVYNRKDTAAPVPTTSNSSAASQASDQNSVITVINSVINKGDYHELAAYMSDSVKVVKEGTDVNGSTYSSTAAAATISDFYSKSNGAELPWDFTSDSNYMASAKKSTGAVKEYIMQGHIAVSKNEWVLGYNLNSNQKISSFYMSPSVNMSK